MNIKYIVLFFLGLSLNSNAQDACELKLKTAYKNFEEGNIETIPALLNECVKEGLKNEDKINALKLLVNVYLFEDDITMADEAMVKLLNYEPELEINEVVDPVEFIEIYNTYIHDPAYSLGVTGGLNYSFISRVNDFGTYSTNLYNGAYTAPELGTHIGIKGSKYLFHGGNLNLEAVYFTRKFTYNTILNSYSNLTIHEKNRFLYFPLSFTYEFGKKKLIPYVRIGGSFELMLNTDGEFIRTYTDNSHNNVTGPELNMTSQRTSFTYSALAGIGVKLKIRRGNLFLDARYNYGFANLANPNNRFDNNTILFEYHHVSDDFVASNALLSIGYMRSFYNPKKKKLK